MTLCCRLVNSKWSLYVTESCGSGSSGSGAGSAPGGGQTSGGGTGPASGGGGSSGGPTDRERRSSERDAEAQQRDQQQTQRDTPGYQSGGGREPPPPPPPPQDKPWNYSSIDLINSGAQAFWQNYSGRPQPFNFTTRAAEEGPTRARLPPGLQSFLKVKEN